ncbi:MAG TPA: hypothetical protein VFO39_21650 [Candidatus Sulfotelmatobacter sp.]|nr:hypothetical protein [Candidatus Sulfotelmatobacter sp.]
MNRSFAVTTSVLGIAWLGFVTCVCVSQTAPVVAPAAKSESGITSYLEFEGTSDSSGQAYVLNSSVGYNFNRHFGTDVGVPVYFVRASATSTSGATSNNGIGNPFLDFRLKFLNPTLSFGSKLTGFVPVGDSKLGFSTGRATFDWTNRVEHGFESLTPFAEVGIANTVVDTRLFVRPYTTLGLNSHYRAGADYDLWKFFSIGAAGYDIAPWGQQTVFSRVVHGPQSTGHAPHGRTFQNAQQTSGSASIASDNGFSAWIDANPGGAVDLELGYTRSVHYDLNAVSFGIGFNPTRLYRRNGQ